MYNKKKDKILIAHVNQEFCQITDALSQEEFENHYKKNIDKWLNKKNITKLIKEHPELIWDHESDTFIVKEIKLTNKKQRPA